MNNNWDSDTLMQLFEKHQVKYINLSVEKRATIFNEGDLLETVPFITIGSIQVSKIGKSGKVRVK